MRVFTACLEGAVGIGIWALCLQKQKCELHPYCCQQGLLSAALFSAFLAQGMAPFEL